mgnify:CR=1 FL=1
MHVKTLLPLAALLLAGSAAAQMDPGVFREGEPLPHLVLPTIDGTQTLDLAELADGKKVLLIQFASW